MLLVGLEDLQEDCAILAIEHCAHFGEGDFCGAKRKNIRQNVHKARQNIQYEYGQLKHGVRSAVQATCGVVLTLPQGVHAALAVVAWCSAREVELPPLVAGEDACRPRAQGGCPARPARGEHRLHLVKRRLHHALQLCAAGGGGEGVGDRRQGRRLGLANPNLHRCRWS